MRLVRVAARHPAEPVRERRAGLVVSGFAHPDILTTQRGVEMRVAAHVRSSERQHRTLGFTR